MTDQPQVSGRRLTVEAEDGELLAMTETGDVHSFATPAAVVSWVLDRDRKATRRGTSTVTEIEWRGMPAGFVPPDPSAL